MKKQQHKIPVQNVVQHLKGSWNGDHTNWALALKWCKELIIIMLCRASADIEATATNIVPNCLASFISWLQKRQSSVVMFAADFVRLCVRLPAVNCTKGSTTIPQMSLLTPPSAPPTTETTNEFSTSSNGRRNNTTSKHKTLAYLEVCERNVNR